MLLITLRPRRMAKVVVVLGATLGLACGAKTGPMVPACLVDADCDDGLLCNGPETCVEERCVGGAALACDDRDPCTADRCVEPDPGAGVAGGCVSEDLRVDADEDGFDALQPDLGPECGPDCDDLDPTVFPGADERCNARDDDCDLAVDEGASYEPEGVETRVTVEPDRLSTPGSLAWLPESERWGVFYLPDPPTGDLVQSAFFQALDADGTPVDTPKRISLNEQSAFSGSLVAAPEDDLFGVVWWDERSGSFETYFNRLTPEGEKLGPDVEVTVADGSRSTRPSLAWSGTEWVVAWQDDRDVFDVPELYLTFLDAEGFEIGDDRRVTATSPMFNDESPEVVYGEGMVGVAFISSEDRPPPSSPAPVPSFVAVDLDGQVLGEPVALDRPGRNAGSAEIAFTGDAFLVVWERIVDRSAGYDDFDVLGARITVGAGGVLDVEGPLTLVGGPEISRSPSLVFLDGRAVLAFEDDRADGATQAIYVALFDDRLERQREDVRVTFGDAYSARNALAVGDLTLGVAYEDQRDPGLPEIYFTRLLCVDPGDVD